MRQYVCFNIKKTPYVREETCGNNSKQEGKPRFSVSQYLNFTIIKRTYIHVLPTYIFHSNPPRPMFYGQCSIKPDIITQLIS